jgi:hypothetical protein
VAVVSFMGGEPGTSPAEEPLGYVGPLVVEDLDVYKPALVSSTTT